MSVLRKSIIRVLDRPGGRQILGALATTYVRRRTGRKGVGVRFEDGFWIRELGEGISVADMTKFQFDTEGLLDWNMHRAAMRSMWLSGYDPQRGDSILIVGAGTGTDVVVFARAVDPGQVIAVEAHPRTFEMLARTCEMSELRNVVPVHRAVVDEARVVRIEDRPEHMENRLVADGAKGKGSWSGSRGYCEVQGNTLDELADELALDELAFLKMNIEGAERLAIRGMSKMLERTKHVCVSCHDFVAEETGDDWYRTRDLVSTFLSNAGFAVTTRDEDPSPSVQDQVWGVR